MHKFEDSIFDSVSRCANKTPTGPALSFEETNLTWHELVTAAERIAMRFAAAEPGKTLALLLPNAPCLVLCFLAGVRAGRNVQLLDSGWPNRTVQSVLDALQPDHLVTASAFSTEIETTNIKSPYAPLSEILTGLVGDNDQPAPSLPAPNTALPFYTGFTSGSTGMPKGFQRDQRSWLESFRGDQNLFAFNRTDVVAAPGNLTHSLFLYAVIRGLYAGCHTIFFRTFRPDRVLQRIEQDQATVVYGVPTQYDAMAAVAEPKAWSFPMARLVLSSGAKLPEELKSRLRRIFPNAEICEFYGTSEQSYVSVARDGDAPSGSVGKPFPGVRIRILNDDGLECRPNQIGRVFTESALTFIDYALAEQTTLQRDGQAVCVGDLGYRDAAGYLFLVGRADRMILISGKNVYPEEIEATLATHPAIAYAAVLGVQDRRRGRRLTAVIKLNLEKTISRSDLISWCRERLPLHKIPMNIVVTEDWPLTVSHKTNLPRLQRWLDENKLKALP